MTKKWRLNPGAQGGTDMTKSGFFVIEGISKRFGGLQALEDISFTVERNSIHGIIGPNGAGKTTLFNVITGMFGPDAGSIRIDGVCLPGGQPHKLVPLGIARTFQNIRLFKSMSVLDNVLIGQHVHTPTPVLSIIMGGRKAEHWEEVARSEAMDSLAFVGMDTKAAETVKNLSYGQQRLVEFARALAAKPRIILLDEPAAGMNPTEKANLLKIILRLKEQKFTIVLIEHDMKLVMNICDQIVVLDHGRKIAEGNPDFVRSHPDVISAYLGRGDRHRA